MTLKEYVFVFLSISINFIKNSLGITSMSKLFDYFINLDELMYCVN